MNDERPIENLLRRAAKQRSDEAGPPPELHPANRRQLQDEVARQFPKPDAPKSSALVELWVLLTRRWVYGVGVFAVVWVVALGVVPLFSKSKAKSQMNFALNAPDTSRLKIEAAQNATVAPAPIAMPTAVMESDSANAIRPSGGGNFAATETAAAPPVVAAPTALADRGGSVRRDTKDISATLAYSTAASGIIQPTTRAENKARLAVGSTAPEPLNRSAPASGAKKTQATRSAEFPGGTGGGGGRGNLSSLSADSGLMIEEQRFTNALGADQKQFHSLGTITVAQSAIAPTEVAADGFGLADKAWLARGGGAERERAIRNSQAYANVGPEQLQARKKEALALKAAPPVLVNFKIEQQGRQLQVVDGDGSTYRGMVDEESTLYKQIVAQQDQTWSNANAKKFNFQTPKLAAAPPIANQAQVSYYLYRVEGTNRTLNQNVVFTWNFVPTNDALAAGQLDYKAAAQKLDATKLPSQFPALLQNSFINGRAQLGEGREVEINAVPVK